MRDLKLSEIKEICNKMYCEELPCEKCEFYDEQEEGCRFGCAPMFWDVDEEQLKDNPENYKEINDKLC